MEKKRVKKTLRQLEVFDLQAATGGVRIWKPVGYTDTGEPIYEEYDGAGVEPDYGRLRVPGG